MTKATLKKLNEKNIRNNELLKNASPDEKRVLIAKDVLKLLKEKRITPTTGVYCEIRNKNAFYSKTNSISDNGRNKFELSEAFKVANCNTCALGALFVGALNVFDNVKIDSAYTNYGYNSLNSANIIFRNIMRTYFETRQLNLIESFLECHERFMVNYKFSSVEELEFNRFSKLDKKQRFVYIMKNIIKNNGQFIP